MNENNVEAFSPLERVMMIALFGPLVLFAAAAMIFG